MAICCFFLIFSHLYTLFSKHDNVLCFYLPASFLLLHLQIKLINNIILKQFFLINLGGGGVHTLFSISTFDKIFIIQFFYKSVAPASAQTVFTKRFLSFLPVHSDWQLCNPENGQVEVSLPLHSEL